jgi:hypothetical protein
MLTPRNRTLDLHMLCRETLMSELVFAQGWERIGTEFLQALAQVYEVRNLQERGRDVDVLLVRLQAHSTAAEVRAQPRA